VAASQQEVEQAVKLIELPDLEQLPATKEK
jgi:hypothetical protein